MENSIRERRRRAVRYGPPLVEEGSRWLTHVGLGFTLYLLGALVWMATTRYGLRNSRGIFVPAVWILLLSGNGVMWLGAWWFTARARGETPRAKWLRYGFRSSLTVWLVCDAVFLIGQLVPAHAPSAMDLGLPRLWADAIATVLGFAYLANLAARCGWRTLRRVSLFMSLAALFLLAAAGQKSWGIYTPRVWGVELPFPLQPMLGSVEDHHHLDQFESWPTLGRVKKYLPGLLWLACSFVTMLLFAVGFLTLAARRRGRSAASSPP